MHAFAVEHDTALRFSTLPDVSEVGFGVFCIDQLEPFQFSASVAWTPPGEPAWSVVNDPTAVHAAAAVQDTPLSVPPCPMDGPGGLAVVWRIHLLSPQRSANVRGSPLLTSLRGPTAVQARDETHETPLNSTGEST
jgi:hypothetical protein